MPLVLRKKEKGAQEKQDESLTEDGSGGNLNPQTSEEDVPPEPQLMVQDNGKKNELQEEERSESKIWREFYHIVFFFAEKVHSILPSGEKSRKHNALIGVLVVVVILASIAVSFVVKRYERAELIAGKHALERMDYKQAERDFSAYYEKNPTDRESAFLLVKVYLHNGQGSQAEALLSRMKESFGDIARDPNFFLYSGIAAALRGDLEKARLFTSQSLGVAVDYAPTLYMRVLIGFLANPQNVSLLHNLNDIADTARDITVKQKNAYAVEMNLVRQVFFRHFDFSVILQAVLPFERLSQPTIVDELLGVSMPVVAFNNHYYFTGKNEQIQAENLSLEENVYLTQAFIAIRQEDQGNIGRYIEKINSLPQSSAFLRYLKGFYLAMTGSYAAAALLYQEIFHENPSAAVDAAVMYANASWVSDLGALPDTGVVEAYEAALAENPSDIRAANNLAFLRIYRGEIKLAEDLLSHAWAGNAKNPQTALNLTFIEIANGSFDKARQRLYALAPVYSNEKSLLRLLKLLQLRSYKYDEAVRLLTDEKARYPDDPSLYLQIANIHRDINQIAFSIKELELAIRRFPENEEVIINLLLAYAVGGKSKQYERFSLIHKNVVEEYKNDYRVVLSKALLSYGSERMYKLYKLALEWAKSKEEKEEVMRYWTDSFLKQGDVKGTFRVLNENLSINNVEFQALSLFLRVKLVDKTNEKKALLAQAKKFASNSYLSPHAKVNVAKIYLALGKPNLAISIVESLGNVRYDFDRALEVFSSANAALNKKEVKVSANRQAVGTRGDGEEKADIPVIASIAHDLSEALNTALSTGNHAAAVSLYTEIIESNVQRKLPGVIYQNRGVSYLEMGDYENAATDFAEALGYDFKDDNIVLFIRQNYAYALSQLERWEDSEKVLLSLLESGVEEKRLLFMLGKAQYQQEKFKAAVETYKRILERYSDDLNAYRRLAQTYLILGQEEEVAHVINLALKQLPDNTQKHSFAAKMYTSIGRFDAAQKHLDLVKNL